MKRTDDELLNPQSQERTQAKERGGRPKLYNPPEKSLIADDYEEWPKPHAEAKANSRPKNNTSAAADAQRARSKSKNRSAAELEEEKRIAEAKEQEPQAKEHEPQTAAKTKGIPKKIITPEEEATRAEAQRARSRSEKKELCRT